MEAKLKILYVDDEINNQNSFKSHFRRNFIVFTASSGREGLDLLGEYGFVHIIVSDYSMPEMTGVQFLAKTLGTHQEAIRILTSAHFNKSVKTEAVVEAKVHSLLNKPWCETELSELIKLSASGLRGAQ